MNVFEIVPELSLGSRLKRLSDQLMKSVSQSYKNHGLEFKPKWFPIFYLLHKKKEVCVTDVAKSLKLSHPAISQFVRELKKSKLIKTKKDKKDSRKTIIVLDKEGKILLARIQPVWDAIAKVISDMIDAQHQHLLRGVVEFEEALSITKLEDRVDQLLKKGQLQEVIILEYNPDLKDHFRTLNEEWIHKYFEMESKDIAVLNNPEHHIIEKGGVILFAQLDSEIVGTCALIQIEEGVFELAKMAVTSGYQGRQIGKKLCLAAIEFARQLEVDELFLVSNTMLNKALRLYQKVGFREVTFPQEERSYERTNIKMVYDF
ncbi:MAG: GNAT family N-acetyltransferase [Aureispira sp.]|nr:GNAT family N-acetyltransferase [Aureispira sp.]